MNRRELLAAATGLALAGVPKTSFAEDDLAPESLDWAPLDDVTGPFLGQPGDRWYVKNGTTGVVLRPIDDPALRSIRQFNGSLRQSGGWMLVEGVPYRFTMIDGRLDWYPAS